MNDGSMKAMRTSAFLLALLMLPAPGLAATYDALCDKPDGGTVRCRVRLDANGIASPSGFIAAPRIARWVSSDTRRTGSGSGTAAVLGTGAAVAGSLLPWPAGALGGLLGNVLAGGRSGPPVEMAYIVTGYDAAGQRLSLRFRFLHPQPAAQLGSELGQLSGLAMGETRSLEELRNPSVQPRGGAALPETLSPLPTGASPGTTTGSKAGPKAGPKATSPTTAAAGDWESYLRSRRLEAWAKANPALAAKLRQQLYPTP